MTIVIYRKELLIYFWEKRIWFMRSSLKRIKTIWMTSTKVNRRGWWTRFKGALKAHKHISLYESYTLQEQDATILFLSVIPWGEIFAYCHPPRQPLPATGCGHVFQVLSAVTQSGGRDHILSPSYLWAVYLTAVLLTRALCTSCIKTYISNKKMVKSCAAIGCKKRHSSGESFHRFPSSKFRQNQWLASMKLLNPPVLKYAYVCSDHFTDEDYVRNHTLQSGLLQSTVNLRRPTHGMETSRSTWTC